MVWTASEGWRGCTPKQMRVLLEYFHLQREIALEVAPSGEARVPASARREYTIN